MNSIPEAAAIPPALPRFEDGFINMQELLRALAESVVNEIMSAEADQLCDATGNSRNGYRERRLVTCVGTLTLRIPKLRVGSFFPDDVIEVMAHEPKICKYLDIPFQHISDAQLKAMKRRHTKADAYRLVERLRAAVPDIALRTTLLVGYPGETEADFAELLQFVDDVRFDRLGVFAYSEEEGTYSALHLKDDVPDEVKRRRVERIMERQKAISTTTSAAWGVPSAWWSTRGRATITSAARSTIRPRSTRNC